MREQLQGVPLGKSEADDLAGARQSEWFEAADEVLQPIQITEPAAAQLSEDGHWAETQVIQSIKDANLRHKSPYRVLRGTATMPLGGVHRPVISGSSEGRLITPKPRLRTRLKRLFKLLRS
jgi:hypothetical protein